MFSLLLKELIFYFYVPCDWPVQGAVSAYDSRAATLMSLWTSFDLAQILRQILVTKMKSSAPLSFLPNF